jgi:hypothetical protein
MMAYPASERLAKSLNLTLGGIQVFFEERRRMIQKHAPECSKAHSIILDAWNPSLFKKAF